MTIMSTELTTEHVDPQPQIVVPPPSTDTPAALVVLYRPSDDDVAHLIRLRAHTPRLLAIDNSPENNPERERLLVAHGVGYLFNGNLGGIAGAFNLGLSRLFADGAAAVVLFDQDSRASADYFPAMRDACAALGDTAFVVGPRIFDEGARRFLPEIVSNGFTIRRVKIDASAALQRCSFLLSSGSVVSRQAFARLGTFSEALFIDHVDTEYALRALARGVPFYVVPRLVLSHQIGNKREHRLGFLHMTSMNHPAFRRYYIARNGMHLALLYGLGLPLAITPNLITLWQVVQIALFERDKRAKLLGIGCGIVDALRGRLGSIELARPQLAARFFGR